jgi:tetratricopeptide (TPR) repeat protein
MSAGRGASGDPGGGTPQRTRFVGRDVEQGLLAADLDAARAGTGRITALVGEPGIGKTRLAAAVAAEARARGAAVAWGRCHEHEGGPVYWPVLQALQQVAGVLHGESAARFAAAIAPLRTDDAAAPEQATARARFDLFERVASAVCGAALAQPLLIVVDDLHWADLGSLRLLEFLAREIASAPLLLLCTLRDAERQTNAERAAALASVICLGRSVHLSGLPRGAVEELLRERLGFAPPPEVVERVLTTTEGNPFFVIELAELLATPEQEGVLGPFPPGVAELLHHRLEPLTPQARELLSAASVVGREFELGVLARALQREPTALIEVLAEPLASRLVRQLPGSLRHYAFSHALVRETLYGELAPAARSALHAAIGTALEADAPDDDLRLPALAHHFFQAAQTGDPGKALRFACEAGERAIRLLAFEEAVRHFERAQAALALGGEEAARLRVLAGLGEALHGAGDHARSDAVFRDAVALARRLGPDALASTALRFAVARAELSVLDVELNELLEEAIAAAPQAAPALRARLLARLAAGLHLQPGAERRRKALSDEAMQLARTLGDPALLGFVLSRRLMVLLGPDDLAERLATTDEILRSERTPRSAALEALVYRIDDLAERADRPALDQALAVFDQKARTSREPFFLWTAASLRTAMALLEGRFGEAEKLAGEALAAGRSVQARTATLRFAQQLFTLRGWQGRLAEVEPLIGAGVSETQVVPAWRCALANFYSLSGREPEARREFEALAASGFAEVPRDTNWLTSMALLASVCGRLRDAARSEHLYALLEPYAARIAVSRLAVMIGPIEHRLGVLAGVRGRYAEAETHFGRALAVAERMRALPWQAETRYQWASTLLQRSAPGDGERARTLLAEAEAIARAVGMRLLLGWVEELRAEQRPDQASRTGSLRRDGDGWTLVFEGRTTRLRDMIGLAHIARLLAEPGREMSALELVAAAYAGRREHTGVDTQGDAGEQVDAQARAEYVARLRDAREELDEATRHNDRGRAERLGAEIELLARELSRGFGLGGRPRRAGSDGERARLSVSRAIRYAIERIGEHDPAVAEHLRRGIRTGAFCTYERSSRDPVAWSG